jgi:hypothetical protein
MMNEGAASTLQFGPHSRTWLIHYPLTGSSELNRIKASRTMGVLNGESLSFYDGHALDRKNSDHVDMDEQSNDRQIVWYRLKYPVHRRRHR